MTCSAIQPRDVAVTSAVPPGRPRERGPASRCRFRAPWRCWRPTPTTRWCSSMSPSAGRWRRAAGLGRGEGLGGARRGLQARGGSLSWLLSLSLSAGGRPHEDRAVRRRRAQNCGELQVRSSRRACRLGTGLPAWSQVLEASRCRGVVVVVAACQSHCTRFSSLSAQSWP